MFLEEESLLSLFGMKSLKLVAERLCCVDNHHGAHQVCFSGSWQIIYNLVYKEMFEAVVLQQVWYFVPVVVVDFSQSTDRNRSTMIILHCRVC